MDTGKLAAPKVAHLLPPPEKPLSEEGRRQRKRKRMIGQLLEIINKPGDAKARKRREEAEREEARRRELLEQAGAPLVAMGGH